jgi:lipopolysaccharide transport system ATP-binding protein
MSDTLIKVENVSKKFCRTLKRSLWYGVRDLTAELTRQRNAENRELRSGEFWAVRDISFEVKRGQCLGLIGPNGSGKTTLLRMLNGLIKPDTGRITMRGRVGALIALGAGFNPILTGRENVYIAGAVLGLSTEEIDKKYAEIVEFSELAEFMETPVQNYSSGMQVRLGFAVAAQMEPDILLLDEILAVGDARFMVKCINVIRRMQRSGVAIIIVSHNMTNILRFCDIGIYVKNGALMKSGPILDVSSMYMQDIEVTVAGHEQNVHDGSGLVMGPASFLDSMGNSVDRVLPDQPVRIDVPYRLDADMQEIQVTIGIGINDYDGVYYQSMLEPGLFQGGRKGESGVLSIAIDELLAASGSLIVGVSVWSHPEGELLAWSRDNEIKVQQVSRNNGRVELKPQWKIDHGKQEEVHGHVS